MASLLVPGVSLNWRPLASQWRRKSHNATSKRSVTCVHGTAAWGFKPFLSPLRFSQNSFNGCRARKRLAVRAAAAGSVKSDGEKSSREFESEATEGVRETIDVTNDVRERKEEQPAEEKLKREYLNFRADLEMKRKKFWNHFREQHKVYNEERKEWGVGFGPIYTVHEDKDGNLYRVDVHVEEIFNRTGINPAKVEFAEAELQSRAEQRIARAKGHARDIELGLVKPSPASVLYEYEREGFNETTNVGSWVGRKSNSLPNSSPLQYLSLIPLLFPLITIGLLGRILLLSAKKEKDPVVEEKEVRLMRMRKLKAQMSRPSSAGAEDNGQVYSDTVEGDLRVDLDEDRDERLKSRDPKVIFGEIVGEGQPRVNDEEFQRKVAEIQAMARQARLQEQESAEARSAQNFERKKALEQELKKERNRVQKLENLAKDLDVVRRSGAESSDGAELILNAMQSGENEVPNVENGLPSSSQISGPGSDNSPSKQTPRPDTFARNKSSSPAKRLTGVRPRVILSAEEARASIAAKKARLRESSAVKADEERSKIGDATTNTDFRKVAPPAGETPDSVNATNLRSSGTEATVPTNGSPAVLSERSPEDGKQGIPVGVDNLRQADDSEPTKDSAEIATGRDILSSESEVDKVVKERTKDGQTQEKISGEGVKPKSKEEEEEMEWMRDDVLREIVFKVQANEIAGRTPFHELNSEQESLFFKGLERKFAREGEKVKAWIKSRVENIDYGSDGISLYDTPDSYELKWKESTDTSPESDFYNKFKEERQRILDEHRGRTYTSTPGLEEPSPRSSTSSPTASSPAPSSPTASPSPSATSYVVPSLPDSIPTSATSTASESSKEFISGSGKKRTVVASSPRTSQNPLSLNQTGPSTKENESCTSKENWEHTKKWSKDLQRKYEMERDPAARATIREIGQDLDRWITEEEIETASRLLDKGDEGEEEYARMHYEKVKEKIKQQAEMFGAGAMLNKYSEYKPEEKEIELWWLDLPFVLCLGLQTTVDGEVRGGLYSVDVSSGLEGLPDESDQNYHTVAFEDRGDAQNFWTLVSTQPEKVGAKGAELIPFNPKELYEDAKSEGFKVTVIKKGQLRLSVDQPFEEAEGRIVEICCSRYYNEVLHDRSIDMDTVVDEGLGFGKRP